MSKFPSRPHAISQEKKIPASIIADFFFTLKEGNINKIKEFFFANKNRSYIVDTSDEGNGDTPYHVILNLDESIADNQNKLEIIKYLKKMGCPFNLPNKDNVWPIHLAAQLQDEKILNFFVKNGARLDVKDSSNNTPLHYAIIGNEVACPKKEKIESLVPSADIENAELNSELEEVNRQILENLSKVQIGEFKEMTESIMNIPKMYKGSKIEADLKKDISKIFIDNITDPNYTGELKNEEVEFRKLIEKHYQLATENLLSGAISAIPFNLENGDLIFPEKTIYQEKYLENNHMISKNKVLIDEMTTLENSKKYIKESQDDIYNSYIINYLFPEKVMISDPANIKYGERQTLSKLLYLLSLNYVAHNLDSFLAMPLSMEYPFIGPEIYAALQNNGFHRKLDFLGGDMGGIINYDTVFGNIWGNAFPKFIKDYKGYINPTNYTTLDQAIKDKLDSLKSHLYSFPINLTIVTKQLLVEVPVYGEMANVMANVKDVKKLIETMISDYNNNIVTFLDFTKDNNNTRNHFGDHILDMKIEDLYDSILKIPSTLKDIKKKVFHDALSMLINNIKPSASLKEGKTIYIPNVYQYTGVIVKKDTNVRYLGAKDDDEIGEFINEAINRAGSIRDYLQKKSPLLPPWDFYKKVSNPLTDPYRSLFSDTNLYDSFINALKDGKTYMYFVYKDNSSFYTQINEYNKMNGKYTNPFDNYLYLSVTFPKDKHGRYLLPIQNDPYDQTRINIYPILDKVYIVRGNIYNIFLFFESIRNYLMGVTDVNFENYPKIFKYPVDKWDTKILELWNYEGYTLLLELETLFYSYAKKHIKLIMMELVQSFSQAVFQKENETYIGTQLYTDLQTFKDKNLQEMAKNINKYKELELPKIFDIEADANSEKNFLAKFNTTKKVIDRIEQYYHDTGYPGMKFHNFGNLNISNYEFCALLNSSYYYDGADEDTHQNYKKLISPVDKSYIWDKTHNLVLLFNKLNESFQIVHKLRSNINSYIVDLIKKFDRIKIKPILEKYEDFIKNPAPINDIIDHTNFRQQIYEFYDFKPYLKTYLAKNNIYIIQDSIFGQKLDKEIDKITTLYDNPPKTVYQVNEKTIFYFITYYAIVHQLLHNFDYISTIFQHINICIAEKMYYHIAQFILPAFLNYIYEFIKLIDKIYRTSILLYNNCKIYTHRPDIEYLENDETSIVELLGNFYYYFREKISDIYNICINFQKHYNNIIEFLNINSGYNYLSGELYFDRDFQPITLPQDYLDHLILEKLDILMVNVKNEQITFYLKNLTSLQGASLTRLFDSGTKLTYLGIPYYTNTSGITTELTTLTSLNPLDIINYTFSPSNGNYFTKSGNIYGYGPALIGLSTLTTLTTIAHPEIKSGYNSWLYDKKVQIINSVITSLTDLHVTKLQELGQKHTYKITDPNSSKIIIAKLTDALINKLLEYTVKQSVSNWIYMLVGLEEKQNIYTLVKKQEYYNFSLGNINKKIVNDYLKYKEYLPVIKPRIEPDPESLKYLTNEQKFIHYIFNLNYFSETVENTDICYNINVKIIQKLYNYNSLVTKNNDGYTPLHLAVIVQHPVIVKEIIKFGPYLKSYDDFQGRKPFDLIVGELREHLSILSGNTFSASHDKFTSFFNKFLVEKMKDEKYKNNIIKNVTYGVPICLVLYNQMFNLFLGNYQYNFNYDDKVKWEKVGGYLLYPTEFLKINEAEMEKFVISNDIEISIKYTTTEINKNKSEEISRKIKMMENQRASLLKEKVDPMAKTITALSTAITNAQTELDDLKMDVELTPAAIDEQKKILEGWGKHPINRGDSLVDFYEKFGFSDGLITLWDFYLQRPLKLQLNKTLLFYQMHFKLETYLNDLKAKKDEITIMINILEKFYDYHKLRESLPQNLDDNPLLNNEFQMMAYIIRLVINPSVKNILMDEMINAMYHSESVMITKTKSELYTAINESRFQDLDINQYFDNVLPLRVIKYFTTTYSSQLDPEMKILASDELFNPILDIARMNKIFTIDDDNNIFMNIEQYLFPFLDNLYQEFVKTMRLTIYSYEKYILNTLQLLKIIKVFIDEK